MFDSCQVSADGTTGARLNPILVHLRHHVRFYSCTILCVAFFAFARALPLPLRFIAAGNVFFVIYLLMAAVMIFRLTARDLRRRAADEDEGIFLVIVIIVGIIALCCVGIVTIINQHPKPTGFTLALVLSCAPLAWLTLHTVAARHYAILYYVPDATPERPPLIFPGGDEPGPWDFLYYSFVVGMTAQVSDVQVTETKMRRATMGHGVVSFFFNTVLIAMAVNAVVNLAA